jgi:hypothetical protein
MNEKIIYTTKEILENIDNLLNKFKKIFNFNKLIFIILKDTKWLTLLLNK